MNRTHTAIGAWFVERWQARLQEADHQTVARQMRKQGIPLDVALYVLLTS